MKKCVPSISGRIITLLVVLVCGTAAFFSFRELVSGNQPSIVFLMMGAALSGIAVYWLYRMIRTGNRGIFYDEEKIVFVLGKTRREFSWCELKNTPSLLSYPTPSVPNVYAYFPNDEKKRMERIAITPQMTGYAELTSILREKGFPAASLFNPNQLDLKEVYHSIFGQQ